MLNNKKVNMDALKNLKPQDKVRYKMNLENNTVEVYKDDAYIGFIDGDGFCAFNNISLMTKQAWDMFRIKHRHAGNLALYDVMFYKENVMFSVEYWNIYLMKEKSGMQRFYELLYEEEDDGYLSMAKVISLGVRLEKDNISNVYLNFEELREKYNVSLNSLTKAQMYIDYDRSLYENQIFDLEDGQVYGLPCINGYSESDVLKLNDDEIIKKFIEEDGFDSETKKLIDQDSMWGSWSDREGYRYKDETTGEWMADTDKLVVIRAKEKNDIVDTFHNTEEDKRRFKRNEVIYLLKSEDDFKEDYYATNIINKNRDKNNQIYVLKKLGYIDDDYEIESESIYYRTYIDGESETIKYAHEPFMQKEIEDKIISFDEFLKRKEKFLSNKKY